MVDRISDISFDRPIVEPDGSLTSQSRTYFKSITTQALIVGNGSPEGVVEAEQTASYMDSSGVSGAILYIKSVSDISGDKSLGWVLV